MNDLREVRAPFPEELRLSADEWRDLENGVPGTGLAKLRAFESLVPSRRGLLTGVSAFMAFAALLAARSDPAEAATNFLWYGGTSNNGLLTSAISLLTTELEMLASNAVIVSSVGGASGVFTNSNTAQAIWADLFFSVGGRIAEQQQFAHGGKASTSRTNIKYG